MIDHFEYIRGTLDGLTGAGYGLVRFTYDDVLGDGTFNELYVNSSHVSHGPAGV